MTGDESHTKDRIPRHPGGTGFLPLTVWSFIGDSSTNNEAEYGGLLCGLDGALSLLSMVPLGVRPLVQVFGDSELVTQQDKRAWRVRSPNLVPLFEQAISNLRDFASTW